MTAWRGVLDDDNQPEWYSLIVTGMHHFHGRTLICALRIATAVAEARSLTTHHEQSA
jgi:hypothetical protein